MSSTRVSTIVFALFLSISAVGQGPPQSNHPDDRIVAGPIPQQVTYQSAAIWWVTATTTTTKLRFGTDPHDLDRNGESEGGTNISQHHALLQQLQPETQYFYSVSLADGTQSALGSFITEPNNYQQNGVWLTDGPYVEYLDSSSAQIAWSTNANSSSVLRYGTDPNNLGMTAQSPWGQGTHRLKLTNLKPNTAYFFVVESADAQGTGRMAKSNICRFETTKHGEQPVKNIAPIG